MSVLAFVAEQKQLARSVQPKMSRQAIAVAAFVYTTGMLLPKLSRLAACGFVQLVRFIMLWKAASMKIKWKNAYE